MRLAEQAALMVDIEFAGREYAPGPVYVVGREKVREFAVAVSATHATHHDVDAARSGGYADLVAPATFAVIVAQATEAQYIEDPAAGIDFGRVVHADERFVHHRPIVAGDELVGILHVDSITQRVGLSMVTTRVEIFSADPAGQPDEAVCTVISALAVREAA